MQLLERRGSAGERLVYAASGKAGGWHVRRTRLRGREGTKRSEIEVNLRCRCYFQVQQMWFAC